LLDEASSLAQCFGNSRRLPLHDGTLLIGTQGGELFAIDSRNGKQNPSQAASAKIILPENVRSMSDPRFSGVKGRREITHRYIY